MNAAVSARSIAAIYGDVEMESPQTMRVDRLLVLDKDGSARLMQEAPIRFSLGTGDTMMVKFALAMIASGGETEGMIATKPETVSLMK